MNKEKRYAITFDCYLYAENDSKAVKRVKKIIEKLKEFEEKNNTGMEEISLVSIVESEFGKLGRGREIAF